MKLPHNKGRLSINIVPLASENFDEIINSTKKFAKSFIKKCLEQLNLGIYCFDIRRRTITTIKRNVSYT